VPNALQLIEDLVDVYIRNVSERKLFEKTWRRALFLPHCSRKYLDNFILNALNTPTFEFDERDLGSPDIPKISRRWLF